MKLAQRLIPKPLMERYEALLRDFEWNWTKAAIAALILWFLAITFIGVVPSWWLYWASGPPLNWNASSFWLFKLRDVVAVGLFTVPTIAFIVIPYFVQKHRRRLRGADAKRASGGYR